MAFPTTAVVDTFNRGDEFPLAGNWSVLNSAGGALWLSGNALLNWTGDQTGVWTLPVGNDQEAYITATTVPAANENARIWLRANDVNSTTFDGYVVEFRKTAGSDECRISRYDNGAATLLTGPVNTEYVNGDKIGGDIVGTTITAYLYTGGGWTTVTSTTDGTYSSGSIGFSTTGTTGLFDDFGGGTVVGASGVAQRMLLLGLG